MQEPQRIENLLDTQEKKLAFFQNLILIAAADGRLDSNESQFILNIGNRLGLAPDEVMHLADRLPQLSFVIPEEGLQKTLELQTLVMMMLEDGRVHDREYALCLQYTDRIGYSKAFLDEMIGQFKDSARNAG
jgi:DnaJ-domain-containing protein 1